MSLVLAEPKETFTAALTTHESPDNLCSPQLFLHLFGDNPDLYRYVALYLSKDRWTIVLVQKSPASDQSNVLRLSKTWLPSIPPPRILLRAVQPVDLDVVKIQLTAKSFHPSTIRQHLSTLGLVRQGDQLPTLRAKISHCQPVAQGLLSSSTQIILYGWSQQHGSQDESDSDSDVISMSLSHRLSPSIVSHPGHSFLTQPLPEPVEDLFLSPEPADKEDPTCRVYVDLRHVSRIGCLSGDWVIVKGATDVRIAKLYGLLDCTIRRTPVVWASPLFWANMGNCERVRLRPFEDGQDRRFGRSSSGYTRAQSSIVPPLAQEVVLRQVRTPMSTRRAMETAISGNLRRYMEISHRAIRQNDLIAVPYDPWTTFGSDSDYHSADSSRKKREFAYFRVVKVVESEPLEAADMVSPAWHGIFRIDPHTTCVRQDGLEHSYLPRRIHARSSPNLLCDLLDTAAVDRDPLLVLLHSERRRVGKLFSVQCAATVLGLHVSVIEMQDIDAEGHFDSKSAEIFKTRWEQSLSCGSAETIIVLHHVPDSELFLSTLLPLLHKARSVVATTVESLGSFRRHCTYEIEVSMPDEKARAEILDNLQVPIRAMAAKTAGFSAGDLVDLVHRARLHQHARLKQIGLLQDVLLTGDELTSEDLELAIEDTRKGFADALGAPKIPNVRWDDVGGLDHVKAVLMETIQLPLERPELFAEGIRRRSGMLFYGPPGTGKTLLAKAIATEYALNFFSVKGPELLNMYIGESEGNVRQVFRKARDARPCVVFFDELDSVAPKRGIQGDSGGVMDRIVSSMLAELDGLGSEGVFVIGATNRPDLLDEALLRPGRFDKLVYLGVADTHEKQMPILRALTRNFHLDPMLDLARIAQCLPLNYTGADLYALCSDAMLQAVIRQARQIDQELESLRQAAGEEERAKMTLGWYFEQYPVKVVVQDVDFAEAQMNLVPSVSERELERYQALRQMFEGRPTRPQSEVPSQAMTIDDDDEEYLTSNDRFSDDGTPERSRKGKQRQ